MTPLSPERYLDQVAADVARLDALLGDAVAQRPDAFASPVPGCPRWDLARLVGHLGNVHRMVISAIENGAPPAERPAPPTDPAELRTWLRTGADRLLLVLDGDPARAAWSFDELGRTLGFWQRRQTMENAIHRLDAEQALGLPTVTPADVAADGVSEVLEVMMRLRHEAGAFELPGRSVRLEATDTGDSWLLGDGEPVGAAAGTADALFTGLWRRTDPGTLLSLDGDVDAVRRILALPITP